MTTEFAGWLIANEVAILAKEMRKKNKSIGATKSERAPLVNDAYVVSFKNVHNELAAAITHRYDNKNWDHGKVHLCVRHDKMKKMVVIEITLLKSH